MLWKSALIWLLILPLAIVNGAARDLLFAPHLGAARALPLSGVLLALSVFAIGWLLLPRLPRGRSSTYRWVGLLWMLMTIAFEFAFGSALGEPLPEMLQAYDPRTGNLWLLVVLTTGVTPPLVAKLRQLAA